MKMLRRVLIFYLVSCLDAIISNATEDRTDVLDVFLTHADSQEPIPNSNKCSVRLQASLEKLRKRQSQMRSSALIDLSGYALHQSLRYIPLDMYVTDIKVRTPSVGDWVRVQKCEFSNRDNRIATQILFNDLSVTGTVKLFDEQMVLKNPYSPTPAEFCNMTLRLRRAGLGLNAVPTRAKSRGIQVRTEAKFMDPNFLSVHAYGCKLNQFFKREEETRSSIQRRSLDYVPLNQKFEEKPEIRIITLQQYEPNKLADLHPTSEDELNDYHKDRILSAHQSEKDKLQAVLSVQQAIAQHANQLFQTHGPFSDQPKPVFPSPKPQFSNHPIPPPHKPLFSDHPIFLPPKPLFSPNFERPPTKPISTITELNEDLEPIRPVAHKPFDALFAQHDDKIVTHGPASHSGLEEVSKEMEDVFLRGVKTLLTKYLEKQLETPLKEALLTNIGYTVSYG